MTKPTKVWRKVYSVGLTRVRQRKKKAAPVTAALDPDPATQKLSEEFERLLANRNRR